MHLILYSLSAVVFASQFPHFNSNPEFMTSQEATFVNSTESLVESILRRDSGEIKFVDSETLWLQSNPPSITKENLIILQDLVDKINTNHLLYLIHRDLSSDRRYPSGKIGPSELSIEKLSDKESAVESVEDIQKFITGEAYPKSRLSNIDRNRMRIVGKSTLRAKKILLGETLQDSSLVGPEYSELFGGGGKFLDFDDLEKFDTLSYKTRVFLPGFKILAAKKERSDVDPMVNKMAIIYYLSFKFIWSKESLNQMMEGLTEETVRSENAIELGKTVLWINYAGKNVKNELFPAYSPMSMSWSYLNGENVQSFFCRENGIQLDGHFNILGHSTYLLFLAAIEQVAFSVQL